MKKILLFTAAVLAFAACHKEPYSDGNDGYLVYTSPQKDADFAKYKTYHIADSVLVIGQTEKPVYSKSRSAVELILQVRANMEKRGYVFVPDIKDADLGGQITYVVKTEKYVHYYDNPYWWYDYPGYWPSGYWGRWYGYYYPRPVTYTYTSSALLMDILDLTEEPTDNEPVEIVWNSYIGGAAGNAFPGAQKMMLDAIDQAFIQSSYIKAAE